MHAIQSPPPPVQKTPVQKAQTRPPKTARRTQQKRHSQRMNVIAWETTAKLVTNVVISTCAFSAFWQILPQYRSAYEKFEEIQTEVQITQQLVTEERADFSRLFDPQQAKSIMQENSNRIDPSQKPIVWLNTLTADELEPTGSDYAGIEY